MYVRMTCVSLYIYVPICMGGEFKAGTCMYVHNIM